MPPDPLCDDALHLIVPGAGGSRAVPAAVVGGKAAGLMRMAEAGLPVPPAFVLSTAVCRAFRDTGRLPDAVAGLLSRGIAELQKATGLTFGGERRPLLVSVRSGAPVSMPGMMDTVLNVGLTDRTLPALVRMTGNPRHAWDSYRRLVQSQGEVVHGLPPDGFGRLLAEALAAEQVPAAAELDVAALKGLTRAMLEHFRQRLGRPFPQDPREQLLEAVAAVFRSWDSPRAAAYRRLHRLEGLPGTAVTVQAMAFGNMGGTSGSGVAFSRDPATGEDRLYVDFLPNAQGEDVVSGRCPVQGGDELRLTWPELLPRLRQVGRRLEGIFRDAQDFEFTVQEGQLYLLQARAAQRTPWAALRIACDLVREGLIDPAEALGRLEGLDLGSIRVVRLAGGAGPPLARGIPAGPGVASGEVALSPEAAVAATAAGRPVILVRADIAAEDLAGLAAADGILTARGGRTSHAAVVARQMNKVCVVGCRDLVFLPERGACRLGGRPVAAGDVLSLDGHTGDVYAGRLEVTVEQPEEYLAQVAAWRAARAASGSGGSRPWATTAAADGGVSGPADQGHGS